MAMINGSTEQLVTPGAGNMKGLLSGGAGGGDKPPRQPWGMKSVHELDAAVVTATAGAGRGSKRPAVPTLPAGRDDDEPFGCSLCESFFICEVDLQCHIRRCHVHRRSRRGMEDAPRPARASSAKSAQELDSAAVVTPTAGAGRGSKKPAVPTLPCSFCESFFLSEEDLQCHIRRCHVPRSWRRGKEDAPWPPTSVEKRPSLAAHESSSSGSGKKGCSVVSKQKEPQLADEAAVPQAQARPVIDLNVPAPEVEEEKGSSG